MIQKKEKKNKKRGLLFAFFLHTAAIMLALYPFLTQSEEDTPPYKAVEIQFTAYQPASAGASQKKKSSATKKSATPQPKTRPVPQVVSDPKAQPTPKPKVVITTPEPEPPIKTSPKKQPKVVKKPAPAPAPESKKEAAVVAKTTTEASSKTPSKHSDKKGSAGTDNASKDDGNSDLEGEGEGSDFSGDGLFKRKVIYRADVKKLIKKNGKISVNLCVNRQGNVISADYNPEFSTINDKALIEKAVNVTKRYRFEKDYAAPKKQCGRLTFVCKIED